MFKNTIVGLSTCCLIKHISSVGYKVRLYIYNLIRLYTEPIPNVSLMPGIHCAILDCLRRQMTKRGDISGHGFKMEVLCRTVREVQRWPLSRSSGCR